MLDEANAIEEEAKKNDNDIKLRASERMRRIAQEALERAENDLRNADISATLVEKSNNSTLI
jgi:hypothetical protein